uniref:Lipoxygenase domain-containing protein n=1 Tax=Pygocentrus nattereri TaxID=42514 RepID=A0AAR2LSE0_PYGNA
IVGTLLLVELEAKQSWFKDFFQDWFCNKIVVTTPEGETISFPCYKWLNSKKPVVSLRNDKATLKKEETNGTLLNQREQELEFRHVLIYVLIEYIRQHWDSDEFFGYQFLNGTNPMAIRCWRTKLPDNFPVTDDMVKSSLGGSCLQKEIQEGNIFLCDYKRLSGFEGNTINNKKQSLTAPLCLLYSTPEKKLIPIAIQLNQKPGVENPIFLPSDSEWDWLLAKTFVRSAGFHEHELNVHLLQTHLLAEVFSLATMRNLPSAHPLFKLLIPHTLYTFQINVMARNLLISDDGVFKKYTAIGHDNAVNTFLPDSFSTLTYSSLCLPDNIKERGLENIPNYYYRDDGLKLWDIIHKYRVLTFYYKSDADVKGDPELQNWIWEIFVYGFLRKESTGMSSFLHLMENVKYKNFVQMCTFDFGGWMPNLPTTLRLPPPKKKGESTLETFFQTLPDVSTTVHGLAVLFLLSKKASDHVGKLRDLCINTQYMLENNCCKHVMTELWSPGLWS